MLVKTAAKKILTVPLRLGELEETTSTP